MSSFLNNPFSRVIDVGLDGMYPYLSTLPKKGVSTKIQDYMHLPDFKEIVDRTKSVQDIVQVSPISMIGFTKENQKDILTYILGGSPLEMALDMARVKAKAFKIWETLADNDVEPFSSFMLEVKAARAFFGMEMIQKMRHSKMHIVELWKIHYPETVLAQQAGNQQTVNLTFVEKPVAERVQDIQKNKNEIDPKNIYEFPIKDED